MEPARAELGCVLNALAADVVQNTEAGMPMEDALGFPYTEMQDQFHAAGQALGRAARSDLAYASDPDADRAIARERRT